MRILVAGGAGFLGTHLCKRLLDENHYVICVDNFYTSKPSNMEFLKRDQNFEFLRHDVTFPLYLEVDAIFNLACPASPVHYQKNPVQTMKTNVHGTINLLGLAKRLNAKFIQASTSEIYGDPISSPQNEDYWGNVNPIGIRSCYDEGKRAAETLIFDYHRQYNLEIRIARIFNTYGPLMLDDDGRVVSNFIVQALKNQPITVYGDGSQTRSFCYVDDLIEALYKLFNSAGCNFPINLGNPSSISMNELGKKIIKQTNSKSEIIYKALPEDDPKQRLPDISRAKKYLGWNPRIDLESGLKSTIEYFESTSR